MDIEALIIDRLVSSYANQLAQAYIVGDTQECERIRFYIEANYGTLAVAEIAERAMQQIAAHNPVIG